MKIFLDTANIDEIKQGQQSGILDGVTTNPSLMAKEGISNYDQHYKDICEIVEGDVSAEVISTTFPEMLAEGKRLADIHKNIVVKIPMIPDGIKTIKALSKENIMTNCTLVFSPLQALLAAKAGAKYVSPFIGRLDDIGSSGIELIKTIREIFDNYFISTQILAASIRHPEHIVEAALEGADVATIPYKIVKQMYHHPLTDIGLAKFLDDHKKLKG